MTDTDRSSAWRAIWVAKGLERSLPLHHVDGYDLLSSGEWDRMIGLLTGPIGLRGDETILECGCGAGAFLASLLKVHPALRVSGVDYSPTLLQRARERLPGEFFLGDITDLGFLPRDRYDHTASFGVFLYLSSEDAARRAAGEMLRVTKPGGTVFIGEVSDAAKRADAESIRRSSHQAVKRVSAARPDHLYLSKEFFLEFARANDAAVDIVDESAFELGGYQGARYRYSVYVTKPRTGKAP